MHAVMVTELGGPDVLRWTDLPMPTPAPGEVLVQVLVAGVNYMDVGVRSVATAGWALPTVLGVEGTGRVVGLGAGVQGFEVGQRVAWVYHRGSYTDYAAVPAAALVAVPDSIDDDTAAGVMMQGLTANHLTTEVHPIRPGDTAVVHAAAGGVGLLLTQTITARGGRVIGMVSREEKVAMAREAGADHVLVRRGEGFQDSHHVRTREALVERTSEVFELVETGRLRVRVGGRYPLSEAATAHADIESRRTTGKLLLIPS